MFNEFLLGLLTFAESSSFGIYFGIAVVILLEFFFISNLIENRKPRDQQSTEFPFFNKDEGDSDFGFVVATKLVYLLLSSLCIFFVLALLTIIGAIIYYLDSAICFWIIGILAFILINYVIYKLTKKKQNKNVK